VLADSTINATVSVESDCSTIKGKKYVAVIATAVDKD
jgi:hypothetical protein